MSKVDNRDLLRDIERKATHINPIEELKAKLAEGRPLRVKYGIDPTNPHMHLGHTVPLRLMRRFQEAGHKAVIIMGDYTASLGDPTGRDEMREGVGLADARKNIWGYTQQLNKLLLPGVEYHNNSGWLQNMNTTDWINRFKHWTVQQILDRDDFKKRIESGAPLHMSELLYPLMQGEDSVRIQADIELGGTEQLFTLQVGREMQKQWHALNKWDKLPQVCITLPILRGTDGKRRMGKSLNNFIAVDEEPFEMFSKIMSIPDDLIREWADLLTNHPIAPPGVLSLTDAIKEVEWREKVLAGELVPPPEDKFDGAGPMAAKKMLAHNIVTWLHSYDEADKAHNKWHKQFTMRECPDEIQEVEFKSDEANSTVFNLVFVLGLAHSRNMARRLVEQGAVTISNEKMTDPFQSIPATHGLIIKCGRRFVRLKRA